MAVAVVPFGLALFVFTRLGADFIPTLDEGAFTMMVYRSPSISMDATVEAQTLTDREIRGRIPEVERVFSRIGTAEIATDPMPPSDADFYIYYKPRREWRKVDGKSITKAEFAKVITKEIESLNPGAYVMVAQPIEMRFNEMLEGIRADIAVKIFGNDYDVLERLGAEVKEVLEKIPGTREGEGEVEFETMGRTPMLEIKVKRDVLARYNLQAGDVNQVIAAALGGQTAGSLIEGNRRFDIVVRLAEKDRESLDAIRALPVRVGDSGLLPLGTLADIQRVTTVSPIMRDSGQRRSALMVNLEHRDVESWVKEAEAKVRRTGETPRGLHHRVRRSVREPPRSQGASRHHRARRIAGHLRAHLHGVRQRAAGDAGLHGRSAGDHGRGVRVVAARYAFQHCGSRGLHRVERRGRAQRRRAGELLQSPAQGGQGRAERCRRRLAHAPAPGVDDRSRGRVRLRSDGDGDRARARKCNARWRRSSSAAVLEFDFPDAGVAAGALRVGGEIRQIPARTR